MEHLFGLRESSWVRGIKNEEEEICILEVMLPQRYYLWRSTNVPNGEVKFVGFKFFNVETYGRDRGQSLS